MTSEGKQGEPPGGWVGLEQWEGRSLGQGPSRAGGEQGWPWCVFQANVTGFAIEATNVRERGGEDGPTVCPQRWTELQSPCSVM